MKWSVKKLCGSPSERPDEERTQTPGREDTKRLRNVECGTAAWRSRERGRERLYVDSGARSSELFIPGAMRKKKNDYDGTQRNQKADAPLIRVSHPLPHFARATHERAGWLIIAHTTYATLQERRRRIKEGDM